MLGIGIIAAVIAIYLAGIVITRGDLLGTFGLVMWLLLSLGICGVAAYWAAVAFKLAYYLDRNGLAIQWGPARYLIPFDKIEAVVPGQNIPPLSSTKVVNLAGLRFGWGESHEYGLIKFHATTATANSLLIVTSHLTYVISPRQPQQFIKAWQNRQSLGPTQSWRLGLQPHWLWTASILSDQWGWVFLGLTISLCLGLFGYLSYIFPELPLNLPVHFNALGQPDRITGKSALLLLPTAGVIVLGFNVFLSSILYHREKLAAYLLWGSTILVQVCLWIALLTLTV